MEKMTKSVTGMVSDNRVFTPARAGFTLPEVFRKINNS